MQNERHTLAPPLQACIVIYLLANKRDQAGPQLSQTVWLHVVKLPTLNGNCDEKKTKEHQKASQ